MQYVHVMLKAEASQVTLQTALEQRDLQRHNLAVGFEELVANSRF